MNGESNDDGDGGGSRVKREDAATTTSVEYYIEYLLIMLEYSRIWHAKSFSPLKTLLATATTTVLILVNFLVVLSEFTILTMTYDLKLFANIVGAISLHGIGLIKWCYCISKNKKVLDIVMTLERCHALCQRIDDSKEGCRMYRNEMVNARRYSNLFIYWWTSLSFYGMFHWCANPLFVKSWGDQINSLNRTLSERKLPFIGWYPWNIDNINNYICLYFIHTLGGVSTVLGAIGYDAFYISMLIIICAQFQYINTILAKIDFDEYDCTSEVTISNLERKLKNFVDCHVEIMKFLQKLQMFTSPTMFVQCLETLTVICLVSFEVSTIELAINTDNLLKLWSLLDYFLCASFELFLFCFFASRLQYLGLRVAQSVYFCGWELTSVKRQRQSNFGKQLQYYNVDRLVQSIMMQAQKPIILTGGPFYVLSLETFRVIISMAISNAVMLRTISDRDK